MGRFTLAVHATADAESGVCDLNDPKTLALLHNMNAFNATLQKAKAVHSSIAFLTLTKAVRVEFEFIGGPGFTARPLQANLLQPQSLICAFWSLNVNSLDEAMAWANMIPFKTIRVHVADGSTGLIHHEVDVMDLMKAQGEKLREKIDKYAWVGPGGSM